MTEISICHFCRKPCLEEAQQTEISEGWTWSRRWVDMCKWGDSEEISVVCLLVIVRSSAKMATAILIEMLSFGLIWGSERHVLDSHLRFLSAFLCHLRDSCEWRESRGVLGIEGSLGTVEERWRRPFASILSAIQWEKLRLLCERFLAEIAIRMWLLCDSFAIPTKKQIWARVVRSGHPRRATESLRVI